MAKIDPRSEKLLNLHKNIKHLAKITEIYAWQCQFAEESNRPQPDPSFAYDLCLDVLSKTNFEDFKLWTATLKNTWKKSWKKLWKDLKILLNKHTRASGFALNTLKAERECVVICPLGLRKIGLGFCNMDAAKLIGVLIVALAIALVFVLEVLDEWTPSLKAY